MLVLVEVCNTHTHALVYKMQVVSNTGTLLQRQSTSTNTDTLLQKQSTRLLLGGILLQRQLQTSSQFVTVFQLDNREGINVEKLQIEIAWIYILMFSLTISI